MEWQMQYFRRLKNTMAGQIDTLIGKFLTNAVELFRWLQLLVLCLLFAWDLSVCKNIVKKACGKSMTWSCVLIVFAWSTRRVRLQMY